MALSDSEAKILTALATEQLTVQNLVAATGFAETTVRNTVYSLTYSGFTAARGRQPVRYEITDQGRQANRGPTPQYATDPSRTAP